MDSTTLRTVRRWATLAGSALALAAFLLISISVVDSSFLRSLQWSGDDVFLVAGFVVVAITAGSLLLIPSLITEDSESSLHEPETTPPIPLTGSDLDHLTANPVFARHLSRDEQQRIRERLHQTTVQTIQRVAGISRKEAEERVENGRWTTNTTAAAFLGQPDLPRTVQLCGRISDHIVFHHGVRESIRAIVAYENERGKE